MQESLERDFKGVWIPKEIWLDERLTALEKIILMEIDSLDTTEEGCYASNKYIANFCQCKETKVSNSIKKLINLNYLEIIKFDGRKRYLKSLTKSVSLPYKKDKAALQKVQDINIDNNIDNNINMSSEIKEIINYLNQPDTEEPIRTFKSSTSHTKSLISARLREGFTIDDFKDVIFLKYNEWAKKPYKFDNGKISDTYYRPETLFCAKNFENYLQEYKNKTK